jgi:hypothetical protein
MENLIEDLVSLWMRVPEMSTREALMTGGLTGLVLGVPSAIAHSISRALRRW